MQVPAGEPVAGGQSVDLATAMTGEALQPLLRNQEFLDKVRILKSFIVNNISLGEGFPPGWRGGEGGDSD